MNFSVGPGVARAKPDSLSRSDQALRPGASSSALAKARRLASTATQKKGSVRRWNEMPLARIAVSSLWCESCHIV